MQDQSEDEKDNNINRSVDITVLGELLSRNEATECYQCVADGDEFLCIVFSPPYELETPLEDLSFGSEEEMRGGSFRVFVNARTSMIEKATLTTKTMLGDDTINTEIQIVFAAFNENIVVEMPPELLPKVDNEGTPQIRFDIDTTVRFHEW